LATFRRPSALVQSWKRQFEGIPGFVAAHEVGSGSEVTRITADGHVVALAISPNGVHVAVVSGSSIQIWDISTGEKVSTLNLKGNPNTVQVRAVAYSPDGTRIVSGSLDRTVRVWDVAAGEEIMVLGGHTQWINTVAYSPDGT
jgi:WD40 repeat protein